MERYFGTDGFRGEVGKTLTAHHAFLLGRFLGWYYTSQNKRMRAVIGKDTRLSSYSLEYAICAGITSSGGDAYILHVTTTACVSFIARCENFDIGIMISASHNPFFDNGIKLLNSKGEKLEQEIIDKIEQFLHSPYDIPYATGENIGKSIDFSAGRNRYIGHLIALSSCSFKDFRVGLDLANGSAFNIARWVFEALGATIYSISDQPNGVNVNEQCGSTHIERLVELVKQNNLDVGFAFDGDADRCIAVDENGNVVDGDGILYILSEYFKSRGELKGNRIVATVASNGGLKQSLDYDGIDTITCPVGDKYVARAMEKYCISLGGESSGHIIIGKVENTGDGIVTAIFLMEALKESKAKFSALVKGYVPLNRVECNIEGRAEQRVLDELSKRFEGVNILLRNSGTERVIRLIVEGKDLQECQRIAQIIVVELTK